MEGYIKLWRTFAKWEWYDNIPVKVLFLHLLIYANHTEKNWRGITIQRGQFLAGRKNLAKETGLSEQQIRTALKKLKSTNEITIKSTSENSIITINNYEQYQTINQQTNQQSTSNQPAINHY